MAGSGVLETPLVTGLSRLQIALLSAPPGVSANSQKFAEKILRDPRWLDLVCLKRLW